MAKHMSASADDAHGHSKRLRTIARLVTAVVIPVALVCFIVTRAHIKAVGGTYSVVIDSFPGEELTVDSVQVDPPGIAEVRSVELQEDGTSVITFAACEDGRGTYLVMGQNGGMMAEIRSKDGVVIEGGLDFSGWEAVQTSLIIVALTIGVACLVAFLLLLRDAWFGYEMAGYAGTALFFLLQAASFLHVALTGAASSFSDLATAIITIADHFVEVMMVPTALAAAFVIVSNIALLRHEGRSLTNLLGVYASVAWIVACVAWQWLGAATMEQMEFLWTIVLWICGSLMAVLISFGLALLVGVSLTAWLAALHRPSMPLDYIAILGCGLRADGSPTPLLAGRVDAAREYARQQVEQGHPAPTLVPSGGKGADERWSEAEAMSRYLADQGDPCRVLLEDRSTNTLENLRFSARVIEGDRARGESGDETHADRAKPRVAFATTNYHVLRGYVYAHAAGLDAEGIASKTKLYFWPNAFLRELAGLLVARAVPIGISLVTVIVLYGLAIFVTLKGALAGA